MNTLTVIKGLSTQLFSDVCAKLAWGGAMSAAHAMCMGRMPSAHAVAAMSMATYGPTTGYGASPTMKQVVELISADEEAPTAELSRGVFSALENSVGLEAASSLVASIQHKDRVAAKRKASGFKKHGAAIKKFIVEGLAASPKPEGLSNAIVVDKAQDVISANLQQLIRQCERMLLPIERFKKEAKELAAISNKIAA